MGKWLLVVALTLLPSAAQATFLDGDRGDNTRYITTPNPVTPLIGSSTNWATGIQAPPPINPTQPQVVVPTGGSNNTCESAFNNVCDEPATCATGTDRHDCAAEQEE